MSARSEWKLLVVCPDPGLAARLRAALAARQVQAAFVEQDPDPSEIGATALRQRCNA
jgi:hypothetical protein